MLNTDTTDVYALMSEAAYRLRFVVTALNHLEDNPSADLNARGWAFACARDILEDVAATLLAATEKKEAANVRR